MELEVNKRYLVDVLQTDALSRMYGLICVRCVEVTHEAFKIEYENGNTTWIEKGLEISVVEELNTDKSSANCAIFGVSNLAKFCKKIAKQEDCPLEFIEIVNKEFWNLI